MVRTHGTYKNHLGSFVWTVVVYGGPLLIWQMNKVGLYLKKIIWFELNSFFFILFEKRNSFMVSPIGPLGSNEPLKLRHLRICCANTTWGLRSVILYLDTMVTSAHPDMISCQDMSIPDSVAELAEHEDAVWKYDFFIHLSMLVLTNFSEKDNNWVVLGTLSSQSHSYHKSHWSPACSRKVESHCWTVNVFGFTSAWPHAYILDIGHLVTLCIVSKGEHQSSWCDWKAWMQLIKIPFWCISPSCSLSEYLLWAYSVVTF